MKQAFRVKIAAVREINFAADELVSALLALPSEAKLCLLDSSGVGHLSSRYLIAGIEPLESIELSNDDPAETLRSFDEKLASKDSAAFFTISYDFGLKLQQVKSREKPWNLPEPDIFLARFSCMIVHDYLASKSYLLGDETQFSNIEKALADAHSLTKLAEMANVPLSTATSNFSLQEYLKAVGEIKELIREGQTYQVNLTQQFTIDLPTTLAASKIFSRLRKENPAPFAAFLYRNDSIVVSSSPERFFQVKRRANSTEDFVITVSPIKGTRPRGETTAQDDAMKIELLESEKDRAENTMIVDLMRNDLGKICEYGSVIVEKLCDLQEHPTIFHLESTVSGRPRKNLPYSKIVEALFPSGSITGAPKVRTMEIIEEIESSNRGLSMGAIGFCIPDGHFGLPGTFEASVAIRTMVIRNHKAAFNVGGGIVSDSDPKAEYEESMLKAKALFLALDAVPSKSKSE